MKEGFDKGDNAHVVFKEQAAEKCYKRYKQIQYRNLVVKSLLSFLAGLLLAFLL